MILTSVIRFLYIFIKNNDKFPTFDNQLKSCQIVWSILKVILILLQLIE
jgi:hypothetical protein